jgi:hypothetical protein
MAAKSVYMFPFNGDWKLPIRNDHTICWVIYITIDATFLCISYYTFYCIHERVIGDTQKSCVDGYINHPLIKTQQDAPHTP